MPIYEYRCRDCSKRSTILVLSIRHAAPPTCSHCKSQNLDRLLSRFAAPKSEEARLDALTDPSRFGDFDENDPQSMERLMKKVGEEMGEDVAGEMDATMGGASSDDPGGGSGDLDSVL